MADAIDLDLGRQAMALARQEWGLEPHLGPLVSTPDALCRAGGRWHVVAVESREHDLAKAEIVRHGLVVDLFMAPRRERHGRAAWRTVVRPMFGAYILVRMPVACIGLVTSARGVARVLGTEGYYPAVTDAEIEVIRAVQAQIIAQEDERMAREADSALAKSKGRSGVKWHFAQGDIARIKSGPFASFYAEMTAAVDEHDRARILVNIFGTRTPVEISAFELEAVRRAGDG